MHTPSEGLPALQVVGRVLAEQAALFYATDAQVGRGVGRVPGFAVLALIARLDWLRCRSRSASADWRAGRVVLPRSPLPASSGSRYLPALWIPRCPWPRPPSAPQRRLTAHAHRNVPSPDLNLRTAFKVG